MMNETVTPENAGAAPTEITPASTSMPGALLRETREKLGLSVADVAQQTRLAPRQIEALEVDDYDHLPELPFIRGFIRSYARVLHMAPEPLLAGLPQDDHSSVPRMPPPVEAPFPSPFMVHRRNFLLLGAALLLLILTAMFGLWHWMPQTNAPAVLPADPEVQAVPSEALPASAVMPSVPEAAAPTTSTGRLQVRMAEKTWVEVRDSGDKVLLSQLNPAGSEVQIEATLPLSLVLGQTRGVQVMLNNRPVALPPAVDPNTGVARLTLE